MSRDALRSRVLKYKLDKADVKRLGLRALTAAQSRALHLPARAGHRIPYFDFSALNLGSDFFRVRFHDHDEPKYGQPHGKSPRLYLPPLVDWGKFVSEPVLTNAGKPAKRTAVVIVEGEWKAICLSKMGVACVAVGGVWNWQNKASAQLIPDLINLDVKGRDVYVAFDSDVRRNKLVEDARRALSTQLVNLGGRVFWIEVPDRDEISKSTGIDDWLLAQPDAAVEFGQLVGSAIPFAGEAQLSSFNRRYVHVTGETTTGVYDADTSRLLRYSDFAAEHSLKRTTRRGHTGNVVEVALTQLWLEWSGRRVAKGFAFRPWLPPGLTEDGLWNRIREAPPFLTKRVPDKTARPFLDLVDHLFAGEEPWVKEWFLGWCAHPFRSPNKKLLTSVYLYSTQQGAGKGQLARLLGLAHGAGNVGSVSFDRLESDFITAELAFKTLVVVDEGVGAYESKEASGRVKKLVTDPVVAVNQKYQPTYQVESYAAFLLTTNHLNSIKLEREGRRFFVVEGPRVDSADRNVHALPLPVVAAVNEFAEREDAGSLLRTWLRDRPLARGRARFTNPAVAPETHSQVVASEVMASTLDTFADACCNEGVFRGVPIPEVVHTGALLTLWQRIAGSGGGGGGVTRQGLGVALARAGASHLRRGYGKLRVVMPTGEFIAPVILRNRAHWEKAAPYQLVAYLVASAADAAVRPSAAPATEVVRLKGLLDAAEKRLAEGESRG